MRRRELLKTLGVLGLAGGLSSCATRPFGVGIHHWIGYEPLYLARDFGWLPAACSLHEGGAATDSLQALKAGTIDAACLTLDEVLHARAHGTPMTVLMVLNISAGADAVVARQGIERPADLRGKTIAVETSAVGELMLAGVLEAGKLVREDVRVIGLPVDRQVRGWQEKAFDAAACYEPTTTRLTALGGHRLFDSRQLPETIIDVLAVRSNVVGSARSVLRELLAAVLRGQDHIRVSRQDAIHRIAARQEITPDAVVRALAGIAIPDLRQNRLLLGGDSRLREKTREISDLLLVRGLLPVRPGFDGLFDNSLLPVESY